MASSPERRLRRDIQFGRVPKPEGWTGKKPAVPTQRPPKIVPRPNRPITEEIPNEN